jgi:hypothetical protein
MGEFDGCGVGWQKPRCAVGSIVGLLTYVTGDDGQAV